MRSPVAALFLVLIFPAAAAADTLYVPSQYPTIQTAVYFAKDYDTVLVDPGTYVENVNFQGKDILLKSQAGPEETVIDGNHAGSVVVFQNNETSDAQLDGFFITNGYAYSGAGVNCNGSGPVIRNNIIAHNHAYNSGGGFSCYNASATVENNIISDNLAEWSGGGINAKLSSTKVLGNVVYGNACGKRGGGVRFATDSFELKDNVIFDNWGRYGGGVTFGADDAVMVNNMIFNNHATFYGGGIHCSGPFPENTNNTVFGNSADAGGGGICFGYDATADIRNMILWNNQSPQGPEIWMGTTAQPSTLFISHSDVQGGTASVYAEAGCTYTWGPGMIDADPLFADPQEGDLHLLHASPCRDGGDGNAPGLPSTDFEGDPRISQGGVDMGCDEFHAHLYYTGEAAPGGKGNIKMTGTPLSTPVLLWIGSGVLDPPLPTAYGDFYLQFPLLLEVSLGTIPASGILVLPFDFPPDFPAPWDIPLQGLIGLELTNLCVMQVR